MPYGAAVGILSKISEWRLRFFLWVGLPLIAAAAFALSPNLVPAWKAHNGTGVHGTFTAGHTECSRRSCTVYGDWTSVDGGTTRTDVILYDDPDGLTMGGAVDALDSGADNAVFASAGGSTYLLATGFVVAGIAAAIGWVFVIVNAVRRLRGRRQQVPAAA